MLTTLSIMEARAFEEAYEAVTTPQEEGSPKPSGPMADEVMQFVREDFEAKKERRGL